MRKKNNKDFLGLRKLEKDLNKSLNFDVFPESKSKRNSKYSKNRQSNTKLFNKKDVETAKAMGKYAKETLVIFHKLATKNKVPKNLDEALAMKERLLKEEKDHQTWLRTKQEIKDLQKQIKQRKSNERKEKIQKIKKFFTRNEDTHSRDESDLCSSCGCVVKVWGDLSKRLCIACDEVREKDEIR